MARKILTIVSVALCLIVSVSGEQEDVSLACLGCICDAVSGCNTTIGCSGDVCGPFRITRLYWIDGGKPTLDGESDSDDKAFSNCVSDPQCAAQAVKGYVEKYAKDCNDDGNIDCDDYARLHKLGGFGCTESLDPTFEEEYKFCYNTFKKL